MYGIFINKYEKEIVIIETTKNLANRANSFEKKWKHILDDITKKKGWNIYTGKKRLDNITNSLVFLIFKNKTYEKMHNDSNSTNIEQQKYSQKGEFMYGLSSS